jgi:mannose-6-phosphate isomerase-like protein (cupin superfamily)
VVVIRSAPLEDRVANGDWRVFDLETEIEKQKTGGTPYREFLRRPALSCGIYTLPPGAKDLQAPHDEDEVYFLIRGRGRVRLGGEEEERSVGPGSILYVAATSEHSFFEIEEEMTLLVFFASGGPSDD